MFDPAHLLERGGASSCAAGKKPLRPPLSPAGVDHTCYGLTQGLVSPKVRTESMIRDEEGGSRDRGWVERWEARTMGHVIGSA